jgi:RHS repeat-associated protein
MAAVVAQVFAFDAYGQVLAIHDGVTNPVGPALSLTSILYSGEQFDTNIQQQYLRARFYDPATGRFNRLDPFSGDMRNPQSLHKYLYVHGDPIQGVDPTGREFTISGLVGGFSGRQQMNAQSIQAGFDAFSVVAWLGIAMTWFGRAAADLAQRRGMFSGKKPDAFVFSVSAGASLAVLPTSTLSGGLTGAGVGVVVNLDFLQITEDPNWLHVFVAPGVVSGTAGAFGSMEYGPVWGVHSPDDYAKHFLTASMSFTTRVWKATDVISRTILDGGGFDMNVVELLRSPNAFELGLGVGAVGSVFFNPADTQTGAYGFTIGAAASWFSSTKVGGLSHAAAYNYFIPAGKISANLLKPQLKALAQLQNDPAAMASYLATVVGTVNSNIVT